MFKSDPKKSPNRITSLITQQSSTVHRTLYLNSLIDEFKNLKIDNIEKINHTQKYNKMSLNGDFDNIRDCGNGSDVFKNLRIPDAIKDLPTYEGSRHTLFEFIENVEEILSLCNDIDGQPCSKIFLRAVRNKIRGEANEVLTMYGTPLEWEAIKDNLITHYADKRNETNLVRDLYSISQGHDTVEKYFAKIIDIQSTIINHIKLNEHNCIVVNAKRDLYQEMCLNTFLAGLKEPLGSMIRAMQPQSLAEAFSNCMKEQNMMYMKKSTNMNVNFIPQRTMAPKPVNPQRNNYPSGPPIPNRNFYPQPNLRPTPQYYNHKPFTHQNVTQNFPMNYNNNRFVHKPPMIPPRKVEKMDTTSNQNGHAQYAFHNRSNPSNNANNYSNNYPNNYQFQSMRPPKFVAQEIFNTETNFEEQQLEQHEEETPLYLPDLEEAEVDDENFHPEASQTVLDT